MLSAYRYDIKAADYANANAPSRLPQTLDLRKTSARKALYLSGAGTNVNLWP